MKNCRILLIDDDKDDYLVMQDALQQIDGSEVLKYASSGMTAMRMLSTKYETFGTVPELVVLDFNMPVLNGYDTLMLLRGDERFTSIPVVVYAQTISAEIATAFMQLGALECIEKPTTTDGIREVGRKLLELCNKGL